MSFRKWGKKVGNIVLSEWKRAKRKRGWSYHQPRPGREVITQLPPEPWVSLPVQRHSRGLLPEEILFLGWGKKLIKKKEKAPSEHQSEGACVQDAGCSQHACLCLCEYVLARGREDFDIENARKLNPGSCSHPEPAPAIRLTHTPITHSQPTLGSGCHQSVSVYMQTHIYFKDSVYRSGGWSVCTLPTLTCLIFHLNWL